MSIAAVLAGGRSLPASTPGPSSTPYRASGIHDVGDTVGWTVTPGRATLACKCRWTVRRNNAVVLEEGTLDLSSGRDTIAIVPDRPGMIHVAARPTRPWIPRPRHRTTRSRSRTAKRDATPGSTPSAPRSRPRGSGCRRRGRPTSMPSGPQAVGPGPGARQRCADAGEDGSAGRRDEHVPARRPGITGSRLRGEAGPGGQVPGVPRLQYAGVYPVGAAAEGWLVVNVDT